MLIRYRSHVNIYSQFKILHRYLATNTLLYKFKIINNTRCTFCQLQRETLEHLFYDCTVVKTFWLQFEEYWLSKTNVNISLTCKDVMLGYNYTNPPIELNRAIIFAKRYIYNQKIKKTG